MNYTVPQLGQAVKLKYPGSYDHLSDDEVGSAFLAKHPEYQKVVSQSPDESSETSKPSENKSVGGFVKNIFKSGGELIKNTAQAVIHPVKTAHTLADTALGVVEKVIPGRQGAETEADALGSFLKERYGSFDAIKETAYNDPVGFLLDASTVLGGGGAILKTAGTARKLEGVVRAGQVASDVSRVVDPLNAAGKILKTAGRGTRTVAESAAGATTGVGSATVKTATEAAIEGGEKASAFRAGMRGEVSGEQLLGEAKTALSNMKNSRNVDYRTQLKAVKESTQQLDIASINKKLDEMLDNFGVTVFTDQNTGKRFLDPSKSFGASTIADPAEQARVERIFRDVTTWKDTTAAGLDTLKRRIDNEFSVNSDVRALVQGVKSETQTVLNKVPGYEKMTKAYHQASDLIDDIKTSLSLGDKASVETGIKKLTTALKQNNEMRVTFIKELEKTGAANLTEKIAGSAMSSLTPRGIVNPLLAAGGLTFAHLTQFLPALLLASPRVVGEFINVLGMASKTPVSHVKDAVRAAIYGERVDSRQSDSQ